MHKAHPVPALSYAHPEAGRKQALGRPKACQYLSYYLQKDRSPRHRKLHNGVPGPPEKVEPGSREFGVVVQPSALSGTSGVVRWRIAGGGPSGDRVMSVMWGKPYSQQFWRTWLAVGLSYPGKDMPSYKDMYSSKVGYFLSIIPTELCSSGDQGCKRKKWVLRTRKSHEKQCKSLA